MAKKKTEDTINLDSILLNVEISYVQHVIRVHFLKNVI